MAQLRSVLGRRITAWTRRARKEDPSAELEADLERMRASVEAILERLQSSGLLNDAQFAERRAAALTRAGKSRRAVAFELSRKGVAEETVRAATPNDAETELAAAVALMRKKRLGAYAREAPDPKTKQKWLGAFARGGFSFATADRALRLDRDTADELLRGLR